MWGSWWLCGVCIPEVSDVCWHQETFRNWKIRLPVGVRVSGKITVGSDLIRLFWETPQVLNWKGIIECEFRDYRQVIELSLPTGRYRFQCQSFCGKASNRKRKKQRCVKKPQDLDLDPKWALPNIFAKTVEHFRKKAQLHEFRKGRQGRGFILPRESKNNIQWMNEKRISKVEFCTGAIAFAELATALVAPPPRVPRSRRRPQGSPSPRVI